MPRRRLHSALARFSFMLSVLLLVSACGGTTQTNQASGIATPSAQATATAKPAPTRVSAAQPLKLPASLKKEGPLAGQTIKIISDLPRTGGFKPESDSMVNAYKLAFEMMDYKIAGATIVFEDWDGATQAAGKWDPQQEAANAAKAVADPDIMAVLGTYNSGAAKIIIPVLNKADLIMISPGNTLPSLTKPGTGDANEPAVYYPSGKRNYCRVIAADDLQGAAAARWAQQLGFKRAYVINDTEAYGQTLSEIFAEKAQELGIAVVGGPEGIDPTAKSYQVLSMNMKDMNPELIYYGGIAENNIGKLTAEVKALLGPNVKIMGADGIFVEQFLKDAGVAAEGAFVTLPGVAPSQLTGNGAAFYDAYLAKYGTPPGAFAGYAFESALVAMDGIMRAGVKDRDKIRDAVLQTKDFEGILGQWSFDQNCDTTLTTMSGRQVASGKFDNANAIMIEAK